MIDRINAIKEEIERLNASSAEKLDELRIQYLSKKGVITALFSDFRTVRNFLHIPDREYIAHRARDQQIILPIRNIYASKLFLHQNVRVREHL